MKPDLTAGRVGVALERVGRAVARSNLFPARSSNCRRKSSDLPGKVAGRNLTNPVLVCFNQKMKRETKL
jgi:hypothetical protein